MALPYKRKGSRFWYIAPTINGVQDPRSSETTDYDEALRKLRILEGKIASNSAITAKTDKGSLAALLEFVRQDYDVQARGTKKDTARRIDKHLVPAIGYLPAGKVNNAIWGAYILRRRPASNATINRERSVVLRAFELGKRAGTVSAIPYLDKLEEDNRREGFFEDVHFRSVLGRSNSLLRDILILAYYTGWRGKSLLTPLWPQVDFSAQVIRLARKKTKNRKSTVFPLEPFPELAAMLEARYALTKALEKQEGRIIPYVFHRNGQPVKSIRKAWELTRVRAGVPGKLLHDFRRTAVRRLKKLGFAESEIMSMVGFKTREMFDRYDITIEEDILEKADLIARRVLQKLK